MKRCFFLIFAAVTALRCGDALSDGNVLSAAPADSSVPDGGGFTFWPSSETYSRLKGKYINVGFNSRQFSDDELRALATGFDIVRFPMFHANRDRALHHEAAFKLRELNPDLIIEAYFPTSYRWAADVYGAETFKDEWYLRNRQTGELIHKHRGGDASAWIDLTNPEYREWAKDVIKNWMHSVPYSGIHMDNANPLGAGDDEDWRKDWNRLVGPRKVKAWDAALQTFISEINVMLDGIGKTTTYNGIARKSWRPTRNTELLAYSDGVTNEDFCYHIHDGLLTPQELREDIDLQLQLGNQQKVVMQKVKYGVRPWDASLAQLGRYCFVNFLMGYVPNYAFFKFGPSYNGKEGELQANALEIELPLGLPQTDYAQEEEGFVYRRGFANGWVYVNMEATERTVVLPQQLTLMNGGVAGQTYTAGASYTIPAQDAALFLITVP